MYVKINLGDKFLLIYVIFWAYAYVTESERYAAGSYC